MPVLNSLSLDQMVRIIHHGLERSNKPQRVLIAGAGMAGLVAGSLLKEAGHDVTILEASRRVGGRIFTVRSPFSEGHYFEAGAMRIPRSHSLTLAYIRKYKLPVNKFINQTPNDLIYVNGVKTRRRIYERSPDILNFPVAKKESGKTAEDLIRLVAQPVIDFIRQDPERNWPRIIEALDRYSMETFLRYNPLGPSLTAEAVDMIKVLLAFEGFPELSFLEVLRNIIAIAPESEFYEITGGNDQLPNAFFNQLSDHILFSMKVTSLSLSGNYLRLSAIDTNTMQKLEFTADRLILTIPFSLMNFIEVQPYDLFSYYKWKAIHQLHYVSSTKIGIQFSRRFWEDAGMFGGQTVTDLPIRFAYYPSHRFGDAEGVVLASYTWEDDALPWVSMSRQVQVEEALGDLAEIHGEQTKRYFVSGFVQNWALHPYSAGAFSMPKPNQEKDLSPYIALPEGNIHFAGEHTSHFRSWIQGAIESGIRAAYEVNQAD